MTTGISSPDLVGLVQDRCDDLEVRRCGWSLAFAVVAVTGQHMPRHIRWQGDEKSCGVTRCCLTERVGRLDEAQPKRVGALAILQHLRHEVGWRLGRIDVPVQVGRQCPPNGRGVRDEFVLNDGSQRHISPRAWRIERLPIGPRPGAAPMVDPWEIEQEFPGLDLVIDAEGGGEVPTTVVDLSFGDVRIVREGAGPIDDLG